jgi:peptidoglycan/LPS O-acetylase OafA/YrhL
LSVDPLTATVERPPGSRRRLEHVDAMRPLKQVGVVSTHTLLAFAPLGSLLAGGSLMLLHVTREGFLFLSACMLTYSYRDLGRGRLVGFYRRRFVSVALPYLCWTVIYFVVTLPSQSGGVLGRLGHLGYLVASGYYQLYYLLVIMQFYVLFPFLLALLRRVQRRGLLMAASLVVQLAVVSATHWGHLPRGLSGFWASRDLVFYQFYVLAGMVVALSLDRFHDWLCARWRQVVACTIACAGLAETWFVVAHQHPGSWLGPSSDPFQPIVVPFNIGAIACIYLVGVLLVGANRPAWFRAVVRSGSDNAYGVYLAQMLFVVALSWLGWRSLDGHVPWPLVCLVATAIVFGGCVLLTSVLARTPLAVALTGRAQEPWSTWLPGHAQRDSRPAAARSAPPAPLLGVPPEPRAVRSAEAMDAAMSR